MSLLLILTRLFLECKRANTYNLRLNSFQVFYVKYRVQIWVPLPLLLRGHQPIRCVLSQRTWWTWPTLLLNPNPHTLTPTLPPHPNPNLGLGSRTLFKLDGGDAWPSGLGNTIISQLRNPWQYRVENWWHGCVWNALCKFADCIATWVLLRGKQV
jgi:hypothetical protein